MSQRGAVNQYILRGLKSSTNFTELSTDMILKLSKAKGKDFLSQLRELCVHAVPQQEYTVQYANALLQYIRDAADSDTDRKSIRTCIFLLCEIISSTPKSLSNPIANNFIAQLQDDVVHSGLRACLSWRILGRFAELSSATVSVKSLISNCIKNLQYPEKKKSFLGQKKATQDYENQLHLWASCFSSMRRANIVPQKECIPIILIGCNSEHSVIAVHAAALLRKGVEENPAEWNTVLQSKLKDMTYLSRATADYAICVHLIHAARAMMKSASSASMGEDSIRFIVNMLKSPR
jgi:hypothetical protein